MEGPRVPVEGVQVQDEVAYEQALVDEIDACFEALDMLQRRWLKELSNGDIEKAQGRRCVLAVTGLHHVKYARCFQVTADGVAMVPIEGSYNTIVQTPIQSLVAVLKGVLSGDDEAFSKEWARGTSKLIGERRIHDGIVFSEIFRKLAQKIRKYRESNHA